MKLSELRAAVADVLTEAGIPARPYISETITPPGAVVVPGQPYWQLRDASGTTPFAHRAVRLDVLLIAGRETAKKVAEQIDDLIEKAVEALDDYDVTAVSRPGLTPLTTNSATSRVNNNSSAPKFVAAVITIETVTEA